MGKIFEKRSFNISKVTDDGDTFDTVTLNGPEAEKMILSNDAKAVEGNPPWRFILGQHLVRGQWRSFESVDNLIFRVERVK